MRIQRYTCANCGKSFLTDNCCILCDTDEERTILARFCDDPCREKFIAGRRWVHLGRTAISTFEDADGSKATAVECVDRRGRFHVTLYADGDQFETWAETRDGGYDELQDMRRLAKAKRDAINAVENGG